MFNGNHAYGSKGGRAKEKLSSLRVGIWGASPFIKTSVLFAERTRLYSPPGLKALLAFWSTRINSRVTWFRRPG